jgi:hypothetical protein
MRNKILIISLIIGCVVTTFFACTGTTGGVGLRSAKLDSAASVKRGEYLVTIGGCDDCHSPKRMGAMGPELIPELRLSGFPKDGKLPPVDVNTVKSGWAMMAPDLTSAVGPWGQSFAANITSDATGIGNWPEENFFAALRKGKYKGIESARNLLPPMPWFNYAKMPDEDLRAIYLFLKSTKPVNNVVPAPKLLTELK